MNCNNNKGIKIPSFKCGKEVTGKLDIREELKCASISIRELADSFSKLKQNRKLTVNSSKHHK